MPYVRSSILIANQATVSGSCSASGCALVRNAASSASLPGFATVVARIPLVTMVPPCLGGPRSTPYVGTQGLRCDGGPSRPRCNSQQSSLLVAHKVSGTIGPPLDGIGND